MDPVKYPVRGSNALLASDLRTAIPVSRQQFIPRFTQMLPLQPSPFNLFSSPHIDRGFQLNPLRVSAPVIRPNLNSFSLPPIPVLPAYSGLWSSRSFSALSLPKLPLPGLPHLDQTLSTTIPIEGLTYSSMSLKKSIHDKENVCMNKVIDSKEKRVPVSPLSLLPKAQRSITSNVYPLSPLRLDTKLHAAAPKAERTPEVSEIHLCSPVLRQTAVPTSGSKKYIVSPEISARRTSAVRSAVERIERNLRKVPWRRVAKEDIATSWR